jgi:hypothetical protein
MGLVGMVVVCPYQQQLQTLDSSRWRRMKAYGIAGCKTSHLSDGDVGGGGIRDSERGMALCTCFPKATVVIRVVGHALLEGKLYAVGGFG